MQVCNTSAKMLRWANRFGDVFVLARDVDEELRAYLYIFNSIFDEGYYDLSVTLDQAEWYHAARNGDAVAAKILVQCRSDRHYEYEEVFVEWIAIPVTGVNVSDA